MSWCQPRTLRLLHTSCYSIGSDSGKEFTFHTPVGNILSSFDMQTYSDFIHCLGDMKIENDIECHEPISKN